MPKVPFTAFFQGPLAVYPIQTGQQDPITGAAYLGTDFLEGNYADVSNEDASSWNSAYGTQLKGGRYRICRLAQYANQANLPQVSGQGGVVGWAAGTSVQSAVIAVGGTGYTNGTYNVSSTFTAGTQMPAIVQVVVSGGAIISAQLVQGGGPFTVAPTFGLTELTGGSGASLIAQLFQSSSFITSFDSTTVAAGAPVSLVRGILYASPTAAQILAGAWVVVQESGIAQVEVGTAAAHTIGQQIVATATTAGGVVTAQAPVFSALEVGYALAAPYAGTTVPVKLTLPVIED